MDIWSIIATVATAFVALQWVPEILQARRNRSLKDLNWVLTFFGLAGAGLFFAYGIHLRDPFVVTVNAFISACLITLMLMKWRFER